MLEKVRYYVVVLGYNWDDGHVKIVKVDIHFDPRTTKVTEKLPDVVAAMTLWNLFTAEVDIDEDVVICDRVFTSPPTIEQVVEVAEGLADPEDANLIEVVKNAAKKDEDFDAPDAAVNASNLLEQVVYTNEEFAALDAAFPDEGTDV